MNGTMASLSAISSSPLVPASSACPSSKKTAAAASIFRRRCRTVSSCRATGGSSSRGDDNNDGLLWLPRRDVMLNGLSGVAAGSLAWYPGLASGAACPTADKVSDKVLLCTDDDTKQNPCPLPSKTAPVDFSPSTMRVRQPAHLLSLENQEKYKEAVGKMKALPPWNPLSFAAQAHIHQAYCDSYYKYHKTPVAKDDPIFDVHFSWIFAPWHRMYLYFYERALGDLIGDDSFALPYWSWDTPAGMVVPPIFKDPKWTNPADGKEVDNPLYDSNRNKGHLNQLIDLHYHGSNTDAPPFEGPKDEEYENRVNMNLSTIWKQQQVGAVRKCAVSFLGDKYCTTMEGTSGSPGLLEQMAHTSVHIWVGRAGMIPCNATTGGFVNHSHHSSKPGESSYSCKNDMGFLGSAGWDPLFYSHHSNVDRMWHLWATRLGGGQGITDDDWLDTSFVFYDDVKNPRKVRIKFSDVLETCNLGYRYDFEHDKDLPWLRPKITTLVPATTTIDLTKKAEKEFPLTLVQNQVVEVPGVAVPAREAGKELLLVIEGIEFDPQANNKFDVAINVPKDMALQVGPHHKEYAGSFAVVPGSGGGKTRQGNVSLCITDLLDEIEAAAGGDSTVVVDVVIVPRTEAKVTLNARPTIQNRK